MVNIKEYYNLYFGWTTATIFEFVKEIDGEVYCKNRIYKYRLTNSELIRFIKETDIWKYVIYCERSEPDRIDELKAAGLNVIPRNIKEE